MFNINNFSSVNSGLKYVVALTLFLLSQNSSSEVFYKYDGSYPPYIKNLNVQGGLCSPFTDSEGLVYFHDVTRKIIHIYTSGGYPIDDIDLGVIANNATIAQQIAIDSNDNIYITTTQNQQIDIIKLKRKNNYEGPHTRKTVRTNTEYASNGLTINQSGEILLQMTNGSDTKVDRYSSDIERISETILPSKQYLPGIVATRISNVFLIAYEEGSLTSVSLFNFSGASANVVLGISDFRYYTYDPVNDYFHVYTRKYTRDENVDPDIVDIIKEDTFNVSTYNLPVSPTLPGILLQKKTFTHNKYIPFPDDCTIATGWFDTKQSSFIVSDGIINKLFFFQYFANTSNVVLKETWPSEKAFSYVTDILIDRGNLLISDSGQDEVTILNRNLQFHNSWDIESPYSITKDDISGFFYVSNLFTQSISKLGSDSNYNSPYIESTWLASDVNNNQFVPFGIVVHNGHLLVSTMQGSIQAYDFFGNKIPSSALLKNTESFNLAVDENNEVHVTDNNRAVKYNAQGAGFFQFYNVNLSEIHDIEFDNLGYSYISSTGSFISKVDSQVYVFNRDNQKIATIGGFGSLPTQLKYPQGLAVDDTHLYIADTGNNRIVRYRKQDRPDTSKVIIVAGGKKEDSLYRAIRKNANIAYRALAEQGYTNDNIYYLNSYEVPDLDSNDEKDEVDGNATKERLEYAITQWVNEDGDAEDVVIYLVDHGGTETFLLGDELLHASELSDWLDTLQQNMPLIDGKQGRITIIYDACKSGTFLPFLSGINRTIITSTTGEETAYFEESLSFSEQFFGAISEGLTIVQAFDASESSIRQQFNDTQHAQLDADGDGVANQPSDYSSISSDYIGTGYQQAGVSPSISRIDVIAPISISDPYKITARNVVDDSGITEVFGVIWSPNVQYTNSGSSINGLPRFRLIKQEGSNDYVGYFDDFSQPGSYKVTVCAKDTEGHKSCKVQTVRVDNPISSKAIIISGVDGNGSHTDTIQKQAVFAHNVLREQGMATENIRHLSLGKTDARSTHEATKQIFQQSITAWANTETTSDLTIFMVGDTRGGGFKINPTQSVNVSELDSWLDTFQSSHETVTIIHEGDYSGYTILGLTAPPDKDRIVISSTSLSVNETTDFNSSFSYFFWAQIRQGSDVALAFQEAEASIQTLQSPQLNDNGNTLPNEKTDDLVAQNHHIGEGLKLAADLPVINSISEPVTLNGQSTSTFWIDDILATNQINKVWAVIRPPEYLRASGLQQTLEKVFLSKRNGRWEGEYSAFNRLSGVYKILIYAEDVDENLSQPKVTFVTQSVGPDAYEVDNSFHSAKQLKVDDVTPQRHSLHIEDDVDFIRFNAKIEGGQHTIRVNPNGSRADVVVSAYDRNFNIINNLEDIDNRGESDAEILKFNPFYTGEYYLKIKSYSKVNTGGFSDYEITVTSAEVGFGVSYKITLKDSHDIAITGAIIYLEEVDGNGLGNDFVDQESEPGVYGFSSSAGNFNMVIEAEGYIPARIPITVKNEDKKEFPYILKRNINSEPNEPVYNASSIQSGDITEDLIDKGTRNVIMHQLKITVPENGANLRSIKVAGIGAGNESSDIEKVKLYQDVNGNKKIDASDILLSEGRFSGDDGQLTLRLSNPKFFNQGVYGLMISYDFL